MLLKAGRARKKISWVERVRNFLFTNFNFITTKKFKSLDLLKCQEILIRDRNKVNSNRVLILVSSSKYLKKSPFVTADI